MVDSMEERDVNIDELLARHFIGEPLSREQQDLLDAWIAAHVDEYQQMKKLMEVSTVPLVFDVEKAWNKVERRLDNSFVRKKYWRMTLVTAAAASVLLIITVGLFRYWEKTSSRFVHYANHTSVEKIVCLPDSSEVVLSPSATLAYQLQTSQTNRWVELEGKAFFRVKKKHGIPFIVEAGRLNVEVLGTAFLVDAVQRNRSGVYVESGKVRVEIGLREVVLNANEQVEVNDGDISTGIVDNPNEVFGRKNRELMFDNAPIFDVLKEVERHTGIQIILGNGLEKNRITTRIDVGDANGIAAELAFLCGCKCDTLDVGRRYRLYDE